MQNIKKIAGDILLYLYKIQREKAFMASYEILHFGKHENEGINLSGDTEFSKSILKISASLPADAYNALSYLKDHCFIELKEHPNTGGVVISNIIVTAEGFDIIEGIEREEEARQTFTVTFNIKLADNINVESLIKNEVGSILKASVL